MNDRNIAVVHAYLQDLAAGVVGGRLAEYFTADAVQIEFPNQLNPKGGRSDLATLLLRAEQGQRMLQQQTYQVTSALAHGDSVAVEAIWTGTLAISAGALGAGTRMTANFAMFFELQDGRIRSQRNYDCFQPW